ncbi:hypothetical protein CJU90_3642 [Yarrowia sp. C11]|nr:hypothetical protein CJU90_3642 [Yarrowia sp. C11]
MCLFSLAQSHTMDKPATVPVTPQFQTGFPLPPSVQTLAQVNMPSTQVLERAKKESLHWEDFVKFNIFGQH